MRAEPSVHHYGGEALRTRPRHQRRGHMLPLTKRPLPELLRLPDGASVNEREVAELLGVSSRTLQCWRREGQGPAFTRLGKAVRYPMGDLRAFQKAGRVDHAA